MKWNVDSQVQKSLPKSHKSDPFFGTWIQAFQGSTLMQESSANDASYLICAPIHILSNGAVHWKDTEAPGK